MNIKIRPAARRMSKKQSALYDDFFACNAAQQPENCVAATETGDCPNPVIESGSGDNMIAERDDAVIGFVHVEENAPPPYPSVVPHKYACIIDFFRHAGDAGGMEQDACFWIKSNAGQNHETRNTWNSWYGRITAAAEDFTSVNIL